MASSTVSSGSSTTCPSRLWGLPEVSCSSLVWQMNSAVGRLTVGSEVNGVDGAEFIYCTHSLCVGFIAKSGDN